MATYTVSPVFREQFFDANGAPLAGGFLYFYAAGTSTPLDTFQTSSGTLNTNPIQLDGSGYTPHGIFLSAASYKLAVTDANGVPQLSLSQDGVASTGLATTQIGSAFYYMGAEQETVITDTVYQSGATFDKCVPDTRFFPIDSANLVGTYALSAMMKSIGGATVTLSLVNLTDGAPDTPIVSITSTSALGELQTSTAITFAAGGSSKSYALKAITSANSGSVWAAQIIKLT